MGGGRPMRGNWGMKSWKNVVYARCAGSLQVGLLERKVHATNARQRALQHWDLGTSRISFSPHIQIKGFQQRPPPEKSLKLASCQTRPVASLFWQRFCSYPKCIFLGRGGWKRTKILASRNQNAVPSGTHNNLQLAQNSVLPLGGCGDQLALRLRLAFGTGLLSDSNVQRIGHDGFSDWCCKAQETWKTPPAQNISENSSPKRKISARLPLPRYPPLWLRLKVRKKGDPLLRRRSLRKTKIPIAPHFETLQHGNSAKNCEKSRNRRVLIRPF